MQDDPWSRRKTVKIIAIVDMVCLSRIGKCLIFYLVPRFLKFTNSIDSCIVPGDLCSYQTTPV